MDLFGLTTDNWNHYLVASEYWNPYYLTPEKPLKRNPLKPLVVNDESTSGATNTEINFVDNSKKPLNSGGP